MKTINDFIKELQSISEYKRNLPLIIYHSNGLEGEPCIKMFYDDILELPDKMVITPKD